LIIKKRAGGLEPAADIQRQRKFIEDRPGVKALFGRSNEWERDGQAQTENSQAMNDGFEPGKCHCAFKPED
jgi:hypothetical protein